MWRGGGRGEGSGDGIATDGSPFWERATKIRSRFSFDMVICKVFELVYSTRAKTKEGEMNTSSVWK